MLTETTIEISDLHAFFKNLDECAKIQPVLQQESGSHGRFRLLLEGKGSTLTVTKNSVPILFGSPREALPILSEGYIRELLADLTRVDLRMA